MRRRRRKAVFVVLVVAAAAVAARCGLVDGASSPSSSSPSVRRIVGEWKDVQKMGLDMKATVLRTTVGDGTELVRLMPCQKNVYEWHFTFAGPPGSPYEGGLYHGRIVLPRDYPLRPPSVQILTPNGRFAEGASICLNMSNFHEEQWNPACTVLTLVTALRSHMLEPAAEIGSIRTTPSVKRLYALRSRHWRCRWCNCDHSFFPEEQFSPPEGSEDDYTELARSLDSHAGVGGRQSKLAKGGRQKNRKVISNKSNAEGEQDGEMRQGLVRRDKDKDDSGGVAAPGSGNHHLGKFFGIRFWALMFAVLYFTLNVFT